MHLSQCVFTNKLRKAMILKKKFFQAKDVNMMKRPLTDFQDPCLNGDIITIDFESILQIAVLCVASSRSGRPTILMVCEELDKAYKNTVAEMVGAILIYCIFHSCAHTCISNLNN